MFLEIYERNCYPKFFSPVDYHTKCWTVDIACETQLCFYIQLHWIMGTTTFKVFQKLSCWKAPAKSFSFSLRVVGNFERDDRFWLHVNAWNSKAKDGIALRIWKWFLQLLA